MKITKLLKKGFKYFGYDLVRLNGGLGYGTLENELLKIIKEINVDLILDIGANKGQFGAMMYDYGYSNKMLSFEPLSEMYKLLTDCSGAFEKWHIYERCCIGDSETTTNINVSNMVGNSSIMPIKSTKYNVQQSHYIASEEVKQITLETLNHDALIKASKNIFIKMDVQGFEHIILSKLKDINYKVAGFYIELSLVNLYEGQEDYLYICKQLKDLGYDLVYIVPESIRNGRMIQFNGVFLHNSLSYDL
jgi:FkbM family methyltransferase